MIDLKTALGDIRTAIDQKEHMRRVDYALSIGARSMAHLADKCPEERIAVVGSGPSLAQSIPHLKNFKGKIMALNGAHDELMRHDIKPTFGVLLDPNDWVASYQTPTPGVVYLVGSTVHPRVWQRFRENGVRPWMFVPIISDNEHEGITDKYADEVCFVAGATTIGLRAFNICMHLGASVSEAHGYDSCYGPGDDGVKAPKLHAHHKPNVHNDARSITLRSKSGGRSFSCISNGAMARQVTGFESFVQSMPTHQSNGRVGKFRIVVAGDGAIPWMAWADGGPEYHIEHLNPEAMAAKYTAADWDYFKGEPKLKEAA